MAIPEEATVTIRVGGTDISADAVYAQTSFTLSAAAQPGTCTVYVRDVTSALSFTEGSQIVLDINGTTMWRGYLFDLEMVYIHEDDQTKRGWRLGGVDVNILLDKLVLYNHADPAKFPDGGGYYKRRKVTQDGKTLGYQVTVPRYTYDGDYLKKMLNDFDIDLVNPTIKKARIDNVGMINPDGPFTPPSAGASLRDFLIDLSRNVQRAEPGSTIWYVDPDGYLVYRSQDDNYAPFWVGDADPSGYISGVQGENVRGLRIRRVISNLKNDVLVFAAELNPSPNSRQKRLRYRHETNQPSVDTYGLFQHAETLKSGWRQQSVDARANKIINQQGTPGLTASFTTFRSGLYPGQILWVNSEAHGFLNNIPIRSLTMNFETPTIVRYEVECSFDTQDPWGLILALKRPPGRGLRQPDIAIIDLRRNPNQTYQDVRRYTLVKEFPRSLGNRTYQCSFGYIRDSITVFVGRRRQLSLQDPTAGTVGFIQNYPGQGKFRLAEDPSGDQKVYVEYHVSQELD